MYLCKSYLPSATAQTRLSRITIINTESSHANDILQESMDRIIDIIAKKL